MLVSTRADSNWMGLQSALLKKDTNFDTQPAWKMLSRGGCLSLESNFWAAWVVWNWLYVFLLVMPLTMSSKDQLTVPWLLWFFCSGEIASFGNVLIFLLFSIWSSFLAFLGSTLTSVELNTVECSVISGTWMFCYLPSGIRKHLRKKGKKDHKR